MLGKKVKEKKIEQNEQSVFESMDTANSTSGENSADDELDFGLDEENTEVLLGGGLDDLDTTETETEKESTKQSENQEIQIETVKSKQNGSKGKKDAKVQGISEIPPEEKPDLILYIITDKKMPGILSYFRDYGIKVSRIFTRIDNILDENGDIVEEGAKDTVLMQVEPSRIVFIDTGTGRFTNMSARKALVDLIGISDTDTQVSIFYTDSVIEGEISNNINIDISKIEWHKYRSTADVLANLLILAKKENYVYDMEDDENYEVNDNVLNIKGFKVSDENSRIDLGLPAIKVEDISVHRVEGKDKLLQGYKPKY